MSRIIQQTILLVAMLTLAAPLAACRGKKPAKEEHKPGDGHDHDEKKEEHKPGDGHDHGSATPKK